VSPFVIALLVIIAILVGLILLGAFKTPEVLRKDEERSLTSEPLAPLAEEMLAFIRHGLTEYVLPEDRWTVAQLTYGELEKWAKEGQEEPDADR
jgi:hypothetical protein